MAAEKNNVVLAIDGATKSYDQLCVLNKVGLSLGRGKVMALVGSNGSGKTTIVKAIAGLVALDLGKIDILGSAAGSRQARAVTSVVFDDPALYPDMTVLEHLGFSARLCGRSDFIDRAGELLAGLGISELAARLPQGFSRGQRQKTALAMGLIRPFRLLVLDEPYVGLDSVGKVALLRFLSEAKAEGAAIMLVTHSPELVDIADSMVVLSSGKVTYAGKPDRTKLQS